MCVMELLGAQRRSTGPAQAPLLGLVGWLPWYPAPAPAWAKSRALPGLLQAKPFLGGMCFCKDLAGRGCGGIGGAGGGQEGAAGLGWAGGQAGAGGSCGALTPWEMLGSREGETPGAPARTVRSPRLQLFVHLNVVVHFSA